MAVIAQQPPKRKHVSVREDDALPSRPVSSLSMLAARVRAIGQAAVERDELLLRGELRALSAECERLAVQPVLLDSPALRRQRVAVEARPTGRMG